MALIEPNSGTQNPITHHLISHEFGVVLALSPFMGYTSRCKTHSEGDRNKLSLLSLQRIKNIVAGLCPQDLQTYHRT